MLHRTERFIMWLVTVGLVILVAIQMMMTSEEGRNYLKMVEGKIHTIFEPEVYQVSLMGDDEYVTLKLLNPGNYPTARVLVNNERDFSFDQKIIKVPVSDGDCVILDTRGIEQSLWFEVVNFSENISSLKPGQQFLLQSETEVIFIKVLHRNKF